jgi:hypothetical protein
MARLVEVALVEGVEGKNRAEQVARLKAWKQHYLAQGADKIIVSEMGPGNINGGWIFTIHHKSSTAWGEVADRYYMNPKTNDDVVAEWQKTPVLNFKGYSLTFEVDEI